MGWKVVARLRYHRQHPDASKRGKSFSHESQVTYATRQEAEQQATGSALMDRKLGRKGVLYTVKHVGGLATNPHRKRRGPPRGKVPPHLKKYLFKKGHR